MASRSALGRADAALRRCALGYPETYEEFPWGHRAVKVKGKSFAFMSHENGRLSLSVKLPISGPAALMLPFTEPTHYGLGKSGWITARFGGSDDVPVEMLGEWIGESYRAIAPKKLVAQIGGATFAAPRRGARQTAPRRPSPKTP